jgi:hypothetical protein
MVCRARHPEVAAIVQRGAPTPSRRLAGSTPRGQRSLTVPSHQGDAVRRSGLLSGACLNTVRATLRRARAREAGLAVSRTCLRLARARVGASGMEFVMRSPSVTGPRVHGREVFLPRRPRLMSAPRARGREFRRVLQLENPPDWPMRATGSQCDAVSMGPRRRSAPCVRGREHDLPHWKIVISSTRASGGCPVGDGVGQRGGHPRAPSA